MNFQKTINHIEQLCVQADSMILQGQNSDKKFTLYLRETTEKVLRESFEETKYKMDIDYVGDFVAGKTLPGIVYLKTKNESLLNQAIDNKNKANEADKKIQNFEQKWLSAIPYINETDIDQLLRVLLINNTSGFDAALAYLRGEMKTITPRPFDPKIVFY